MTLAPVWRTRIYAAGAAVVAVWLGSAIAQQELFWPMLCLGVFAGLLLMQWQPLPVGTVLLGAAVFGYIVGNRGFAQISASTTLPLLPAELVLLVGLVILLVQSAFRGELPFRRDVLNLALLVWIVLGAGRMFFDFRQYGFNALRDFATVYYVLFFFLAQEAAKNEPSRRFLHGCLLGSCLLLLVIQPLYEQFPRFFLEILTFRQIPVIFYKGDLVGTFLGVGTVMFFLRFEERRKWWMLPVSLALLAGTLTSNNRSSMFGLAVVTILLLICGKWRFAAVQFMAGAGAVLVILLATQIINVSWEKTPLHGAYERIVSLSDPFGERRYSGEDTASKGDNNRFRAVWWRSVIDETVEANPYLGLGFGYDLAGRFVRQYYPDLVDEFYTRSPHNVLLTIFGRMGVVGLAPFLFMAGLSVVRTVQSARRGISRCTALWCSVVVILVSACFGVVLEGPMGAVVFWTVLGLANADRPGEIPVRDAADADPAASADLLPAQPVDEVRTPP